ncbi:xanthine dehydrogenase molybdenum-binding subunit XdhA [Clostridia bacterium]|nr:xanthine dehydrogenase molybdenum-binding subunit XdhA [Clostridia bacterium]
MDFTTVGKSYKRKDAAAKVTGKAQYTRDIGRRNMLYAKVKRSTIAHGNVIRIDASKAEALEGVIKVFTPDNLPCGVYPTAGHPHSLDPAHQDIADRMALTKKVRFYGDEVAAVVAVDELTAKKALDLIEVEYEELPFYLDAEEALKEDAVEIHENSKNIIGHNSYTVGDVDIREAFAMADYVFEDVLEVKPVQHCHLENHVAYAYTEGNGRLVVMSSTQIPHICRRILSQALSIPAGMIRVIKPIIGGGFGNKQDICIEPLVAAMSLALGGKPVMYDMDREECMSCTRTRHGARFYMKTAVRKDGRFLAKELTTYGNGGAYAAHGHSQVGKMGGNFYRTYPAELATKYEGYTAYTNCSVAAAMRAYGIPQITFAVESHVDNIAKAMNMDPIKLREMNMVKQGFKDKLSGVTINTCGLPEVIKTAKEYIHWDAKRAEYAHQTGDKRRGVGFSLFSYPTSTWPVALEIAGARMVMNQDGSICLQMGATEIGQGAATVFSQMAAETIGLTFDMVHFEEFTDTDICPFDTGAYASRQTYVGGKAVKKAGLIIKDKILVRAAELLSLEKGDLDIEGGYIIRIDNGEKVSSVEDIAMDSYYNRHTADTISTDITATVETNGIAFGGSAAEVEVDIRTGRVEILKLINVHDSGKIINPVLAEGQVHGGMSMSLGYALSEVMLYNPKNGAPRNNNLLDYKLPTIMDTPKLDVGFVELYEPTGAYGNKALGEPPTITPAPAIRNAILHATGVTVNQLPMNPQGLFEHFGAAGLIEEV